MAILPGDCPEARKLFDRLFPEEGPGFRRLTSEGEIQVLDKILKIEARVQQLETIVTQLADLIHRVNT